MPPIDPNYLINDLQKRLANTIKRGRVNSVDFESIPPLVKVEIEENVITNWMPFVTGRASAAGVSDWQPLAVNEQVIMICDSGDFNNGVVIASLPDQTNPPPDKNPNLHVTKYSDGTIVSYDTEAHLMTAVIAEEGNVNLTCTKLTVTGAIHATEDITTAANMTAVDITGSGEVSDKTRSMSGDRGIYNKHKHTDAESRPTSAPDSSQ
jgi:phage baseplate assembly protein V